MTTVAPAPGAAPLTVRAGWRCPVPAALSARRARCRSPRREAAAAAGVPPPASCVAWGGAVAASSSPSSRTASRKLAQLLRAAARLAALRDHALQFLQAALVLLGVELPSLCRSSISWRSRVTASWSAVKRSSRRLSAAYCSRAREAQRHALLLQLGDARLVIGPHAQIDGIGDLRLERLHLAQALVQHVAFALELLSAPRPAPCRWPPAGPATFSRPCARSSQAGARCCGAGVRAERGPCRLSRPPRPVRWRRSARAIARLERGIAAGNEALAADEGAIGRAHFLAQEQQQAFAQQFGVAPRQAGGAVQRPEVDVGVVPVTGSGRLTRNSARSGARMKTGRWPHDAD